MVGMLVFAVLLLIGSVATASTKSYDDSRGEIVGIDEDASTTRISNSKVLLQHKRLDLLVEAVDEDGRLIDDDDRYRVVAVVDEDGYYEKTVSALYKRNEDARRLSTTLGYRTDYVTIYLLCDNCRTGYKFGHAGAYNKWNIVDAVPLRVYLDEDFSNKKNGRTSYRSWKNFEDYDDFFDNKNRYSNYSYGRYYGSSKCYSSCYSSRYDKDRDDDDDDDEYYSRDYDKYSWKNYRHLGTKDADDVDSKSNYGNNTCTSSRCAPTKNQPTNRYYNNPTVGSTPCWSTTVGCGQSTKSTPTYKTPVTTNRYYSNPTNSYTPPSTTTKVYQCSSNGCKWIYTKG